MKWAEVLGGSVSGKTPRHTLPVPVLPWTSPTSSLVLASVLPYCVKGVPRQLPPGSGVAAAERLGRSPRARGCQHSGPAHPLSPLAPHQAVKGRTESALALPTPHQCPEDDLMGWFLGRSMLPASPLKPASGCTLHDALWTKPLRGGQS